MIAFNDSLAPPHRLCNVRVSLGRNEQCDNLVVDTIVLANLGYATDKQRRPTNDGPAWPLHEPLPSVALVLQAEAILLPRLSHVSNENVNGQLGIN
jgi:hypothetical protein